MGYDCTFHLVDERAIREEFVPKLLGRLDRETPLDRVRGDDAGQLWADARRALEEGVDSEGDELGDDDVASFLCQLALAYSSCSLPYHYERGWAFSLWPAKEFGADFPDAFAHSPEPLFEEVVRQYPRLGGKFPKEISGNYSTGVYVPAARVGEVRQWLEAGLAKLTKGDRRTYRGLLAVLKAAEERGLAYWEATDLAVPIMGGVPGDPALMTAGFLRNTPGGAPAGEQFTLPPADGGFNRAGGGGDVHVLAAPCPDTTVVADLSRWPPALHVRPDEFAWHADRDRAGRWLFVSRVGTGPRGGPARARVLSDPRGEPEVVLQLRDGRFDVPVDDGFLVGGRALLVPDARSLKVGSEAVAWLQDGAGLVPALGLPPHRVRKGQYGNEPIVHGLARLAGGSEVLLWEGDGYEWDGAGFRPTFPLGLTNVYGKWSAVPAGDDGFFFIAGARLFEARRGRPPVPHVPQWSKLTGATPGPAGSLLLKEGRNPDGDVGKLYFPADQTFAHVEPELLGDQDLYDFLCWAQGADRVVASDSSSLYAVPVETVLALPRYDVKTGRQVST